MRSLVEVKRTIYRTLVVIAIGAIGGVVVLALMLRFGWPVPDGTLLKAGTIGALIAAFYVYVHYKDRPSYVRSTPAAVVAIMSGALSGVTVVLVSHSFGWSIPGWDWIAVACLGAFVGIGELVSRYQDAPDRALFTVPATFYILLNAGAAVGALALTNALGWSVTAPGAAADDALHWPQVLVAGLGAMSLLRSALFTVRAGTRASPSVRVPSSRPSSTPPIGRSAACGRKSVPGRLHGSWRKSSSIRHCRRCRRSAWP